MQNQMLETVLKVRFHKRFSIFDFIACLHATESPKDLRCTCKTQLGLSGPYLPCECYLTVGTSSLSRVGLSGPYLPCECYPTVGTSSLSRVGLSGLEPPTSRLSGVRSNRLSYKPLIPASTCSPMPSPA